MKKAQRERYIKNAVDSMSKIKPMTLNERIAWAVSILVIDLLVFFVPLMAIITFAVILARPVFIKNFIDRLYADVKG